VSDLTKLKNDHRELKKMFESRGWAILAETMNNEVLTAALAIANSAEMSVKEIDFRRGSIWAAHQLIRLPAVLLSRLEGDIVMAEAEAKIPAKAGKELETD
jgi:hypothetical protein